MPDQMPTTPETPIMSVPPVQTTPVPTAPVAPVTVAPVQSKRKSKYIRNGILWLVLPIGILVATLFLYAIVNFIIAASMDSQPATADGLSYAANIGLGQSSSSDTAASIVRVIMGLVGTLAVIFIPIGVIVAIIYFVKAGNDNV